MIKRQVALRLRVMSAAPDRAEELFHEHSRRIYAYCLRQLGSREEAEDAVQATYLNACRSLLSGFEPEVAQAWLFKVAHNVCLTKQRSTWRRRRIERPGDIQEIEELIPSPHNHEDELFGIDDALAALPEQQRRAILLREWQGLSYREVAAELGVTQGAVETLIFRARRGLAAALEAPEAAKPKRARFAHAFEGGAALLASLKSSLSGSLSGSVAASLAVAASATAIATGPGIGADFVKRFSVAATPSAQTSDPRSRPIDRAAPPDRDPASVAWDNSRDGKANGKRKAHHPAQHKQHPTPRGKATVSEHGGGKLKWAGTGATPPASHAGGNGKSNAGGNGKANDH
jgi:RNA polymerase sigma factor (sigma-70 family)